jgi:ABC-type multidrug transport system fused ATPase/permease subunit
VIFLLVLYRLQPQFRQVDSNRLSLASLARSVEDVSSFCNEEPLLTVRTPVAPAPQFVSDIRFESVSFRYHDQRDLALNNVSLEIPRGRTTAIVGPSGSGKTTLISLLCGFYVPAGGEILVDGVPLSQIDLSSWRGQLAWVCQHAHIFSASILENIRYGRLEASDDEVIEAAYRADAHAFIHELPGGFGTKVGNGGAQLSSGQMQRIALARAFLRKPALMILDEATNSLDSFSEETIQTFLRDRSVEQTVVVISHRLSTLKYADHAVVLDAGRVSETGSPQELAARRGLFSRLKDLQYVG